MSQFVYVLSYNSFAENPTESQVQIFLQSNRDVLTWYYPFLGTFLFKSTKGVQELATPFRQFFGASPFVLTYAVPSLIGGSLPQSVWDWVNNAGTPALGSSS